MKLICLAIILGLCSSLYANSRSNQFVFNTKHQGYTCERWGKKGYKESEFEKSGLSFESLDISRNTRRARVNVVNEDMSCKYTAIFDREKGNTFVTFNSSTTEGENCIDLKLQMDEFMVLGWNYKILNNKYLSVLFHAGITSECSETTNESYARFYYSLL